MFIGSSKYINKYTLVRKYLTNIVEFHKKREDINKAIDYFSNVGLIKDNEI